MRAFKLPHRIFLYLLVAGLVRPVFSQVGFNLFNQRNHPELHWQVLETSHFQIIYHQRLERIAVRSAEIAETCFETLSVNFGHVPDKKIPIYLSDQDEIANGFDVSNRYIVIWVNANSYIDFTTGPDKWLRKVIAHALVHFFHFSQIATWTGFFGHAFTQTPTWFIEGLAQYESEIWNVHRGDLILRTRVLEDEMNYAGFQAPTDGAMVYASGNAAVRYLAQKYGDDTLQALLNHRSHFIFPYYNFNKAFQQVLEKSPAEFLKEWRKQMRIYYHSVYAQKEELDRLARRWELPFQFISDFKISPDGTRLAVVGMTSLAEPIHKLYLVDAQTRQIIKILENNQVLPGIDFSPDGRQLVYAKFHRGKNGSLIPGILTMHLNGEKEWLIHEQRARMPVWTRRQEIIYIENENGTDNLHAISLTTRVRRQLTHFAGDTQLSTPRLSPEQHWLAFLYADSTGIRNLAALDCHNLQIVPITNDSLEYRHPVWSPDGQRLAFTSYQTGIPNLFQKKLVTNISDWKACPVQQITDAAQGLFLRDWQRDTLFALVLESKQSQQIYQIPADRQVTENPVQIKPHFVAWQHHRPPNGIPDFQPAQPAPILKQYPYHSLRQVRHYFTIPLPLIEATRTGFSFISYWAEPLAKHQFLGVGDVALNEPSRSRYLFSYLNNQWHPTLSLSAFHFPLEAQLFAGELLVTEKQGFNLTGWLPFNSGRDLFANHRFSLGFSYFENNPVNSELFRKSMQPEFYRIGEFLFGYQWKWRPPHRWNQIHPLTTKGFKVNIKIADNNWGSHLKYQSYEWDGYGNQVLPWKSHVIFGRMLFQAVQGRLPVQQQIGFDKYDQLDLGLDLPLGDRPRLRGEREYHFGNRAIFGNLEYRLPLVSHLGWYVAGITFGKVTGAAFLDFGAVWNTPDISWSKVRFLQTAGIEFKNAVHIGSFFFVHEMGWARKLKQTPASSELFYRIRSVVPF